MGFLSDLKSTVSLSFIFGALFVLLIIFVGDFQGIDFFLDLVIKVFACSRWYNMGWLIILF